MTTFQCFLKRLGARHDADIEGCSESGFIMSNADSESQYFFSSCSDNDIGEFLDSTNAACLRNNESPKEHPILNDAAPSLQEQCEMYNANGYVPEVRFSLIKLIFIKNCKI